MTTSTQACECRASERAFVGAVINGDARAADHQLAERDFADPLCRRTFAQCALLEGQGKQADLVTLCDCMAEADAPALVELSQEAAAVGALAAQYAETIRDASRRRLLAELCRRGALAAQDGTRLLTETIDKLRAALDRQSEKAGQDDTVSAEDALVDFMVWFSKKDVPAEATVSTGLPKLDETLGGGYKGGRLYVIGARTGVGKSALMSFCAARALEAGKRVLYVSCEMGERENVVRMTATLTGIEVSRLTREKTDEEKWMEDQERISARMGNIPAGNLRFAGTAGTPAAIRRAAMKMRAGSGLDLIAVDYIQLLRPDEKKEKRVEAVGEITRALKLLAVEMDVPVLAAAQLNRGSEQGDGRPRLCDLRESGSIEQDADAVILLHRGSDQDAQAVKAIGLAVAKNRQGSCRSEVVRFDAARMRFAEG